MKKIIKKPRMRSDEEQEAPSNSRLSQGQLVTLAAYLLGGEKRILDTEDIAIKVNQIAPGRFTWRKYADQINLELVRVYLSDAKKLSKGGLISGSGKTGWSITAAGRNWIRESGKAILESTMRTGKRSLPKTSSPSETRRQLERKRIQSTRAWTQWQKNGDISLRDAMEVFRIDSYAHGRTRDLKIGRVREMFEEDRELKSFVGHVAKLVEKEISVT